MGSGTGGAGGLSTVCGGSRGSVCGEEQFLWSRIYGLEVRN